MPMHLHRQIDKLKRQTLTLGGRVEKALQDAVQAFESRDVALAGAVIEGDQRIDQIETDIEEECLATLALHQPVAFDLRYVIAILKMNHDLERIGDLAENIAVQAQFLNEISEVTELPFDMREMARIVQTMVKQSLDALVNVDVAMAQQVRDSDERVDGIYRNCFPQITAAMRSNPDQIDQYLHLVNIGKQLERVADHAVNIAEDVLYMADADFFKASHGSAKR